MPLDTREDKFLTKIIYLCQLQFTQQIRFANVDEYNNKELIQHAILLFINSVSSEKLKLLLLKTQLPDATNEIN